MADRSLTAEEKKMLEGLAPFNMASTVEYVPTPHKVLPENLRATFVVRPFRKPEAEQVRRTISKVKNEDEAKLRDFARQVIKGMSNVYDAATGETIEYKDDEAGVMDKAVFDLIPVTIISDILMYVCRISGLIAAERQGL